MFANRFSITIKPEFWDGKMNRFVRKQLEERLDRVGKQVEPEGWEADLTPAQYLRLRLLYGRRLDFVLVA